MTTRILKQRISQNEKLVEQRVSLMLNRFWPRAQLLWVSDGSRVYRIEQNGAQAVLKLFVPMHIGQGRLEPSHDALARYERELDAATQFSRSEYGLDILDAGIHARVPFIIFPRVEGRNLEQQIEHGQIDNRRGLAILRQLAKAVHELHEMGYIHCDLKPSNILLDGNHVLLIDFGCVKRIGDRDHYGDPVYFSVGYTPPECLAAHRNPNTAIDMFSFGMVAHELVGAGNPFHLWYDQQQEDTLDSYSRYVAFLKHQTVSSIGRKSNLSPALVEAIDCSLNIDPSLRPKSMSSVLRALGRGSTATQKATEDALHAA